MVDGGDPERPFLAVDKLNKKFGEAVAVRDVSLALDKGEFVTLLGPSGCGKTTTLRCIAGLEAPDSGRIMLAGRVLNDSGVRLAPKERHLGMVFQSFAVWPHMTVLENVAYPLKRRGVARSEIATRAQAVLELVGMERLSARYPAQLSGGQQQRVALARALVAEPSVLLYDEPLSALDAKLRAQMRQEIRALHARLGIPGIFVTHDQEEAMELSDRVYVMDHGSVVQSGTPIEVYERPASLFVCDFLGAANMFEVAARSDRGAGAVLVTLRSGASIAVGAVDSVAQAGHLVIRPHRVRIGAPHALVEVNGFAGRVVEAIFLGNRIRYTVEINKDMSLIVDRSADGARYARGAAVALSFDPTDCILV